ncbi:MULTISPECIES: tyrosine-type recombinase/integrase [Actinomadura]|uniref:Tyrosine-type recombinase/integrase n=1 Tax=Actinomadura yumaensis TaxID=111807 RepID=A0ABW2CI80_9ACTN|nr:tyrosine-type recombinase/integrase [Actinomadura sp. J1-007]MWK34592.1 tyrosine-type recombinase/integrase [Actinomadura sp. J1-007]
MADNWEGKTPDGISWRYKRNRNGEKAKNSNGRPVKVYGWRTTIDGKEARVKPSEDLEYVRAERDRIRTQRREGNYVDRKKGAVLFKDYSAAWLASKHDIDPDSSYQTYQSQLNTVNKLIGEKPLSALTPKVLQDLVNGIVAMGNQPKLYFRLVCAILRDAINKDVIVRKDPKVGLNLPVRPARKPKSLSKAEFAAAEKALSVDPLLKAFFTTLAETGARISEGRGLCVDQVDSESGDIPLDRQMAQRRETKEFYLKEPKTEAGVRTAVLTPHLSNVLTTYMEAHPPVEAEITYRYRNGDEETRTVLLIFTTDDGRPVTREYIRWRWNRACKAAGIKLTPHQLRHTLATLLIGDGVDVKTVQAILGHSKASITLDMYADPSEQGRNVARKALTRRRIKAA